jgi:hypothetical protein
MSINNIELKPQLLADLYSSSLLEGNTTSVPEKKAPRSLGGNKKNILVLVSHESLPFLPEQELNFLTTILAACHLSMADIAIVNHFTAAKIELQEMMDAGTGTVLLFGLTPSSIDLPVNFPQFQLQLLNKRTYLHAPGLSELETNKALKQKLWASLKQLFGI